MTLESKAPRGIEPQFTTFKRWVQPSHSRAEIITVWINNNMNFRIWLENLSQAMWQRAWDHALSYRRGNVGPFAKDARLARNWHDTMVRYLREIGLSDSADYLEMIRPSAEQIEFGNMPLTKIPLTGKHERRKEFSAASRAYSDAMEEVYDKLEELGTRHRLEMD